MADVEEIYRDRQGSTLEAKERGQFIGRIAVLTEYLERHQKAWKGLGYDPLPTPQLDEVRCAILAEGAVAELKRLTAELRILEEDLAIAERERDEARAELERARVSAAGVGVSGRASASEPVTAVTTRKAKPAAPPAVEPKPAAVDPLDGVVLQFLTLRGSSASAIFIAKAIAKLGHPTDVDQVVASLERLVAGGRVRQVDLCGITTWRAT